MPSRIDSLRGILHATNSSAASKRKPSLDMLTGKRLVETEPDESLKQAQRVLVGYSARVWGTNLAAVTAGEAEGLGAQASVSTDSKAEGL